MKKIMLLMLTVCFVLCSTKTEAQIRKQEQSMWCWASCIQSALYSGYVNQSQSAIVAKLTGIPQDRPANCNQVSSILNMYNFRAFRASFPPNPVQLYNTLRSGKKIIALTNPGMNPQMGHFIVIQGIAANGMIVISDPATGLTYQQNLNQLYYAWKWKESVVVG